MKFVVGDWHPAIPRYLDATACVPIDHLLHLDARDVRIVMAPTIAVGLDSSMAAARRGRGLSQKEFDQTVREYDPTSSRVAGLYDPGLELIVLPLLHSTEDPEWQVVHEIGHALTIENVGSLDAEEMLAALPPDIRTHIEQPGYEEREQKVAEILAETYAWMVVGLEDRLNFTLLSALIAMLPGDGDPRRS